MSQDVLKVTVPVLGESITEATIATVKFKSGDYVKRDDILIELETEKVTLEVYAPESGIISEIKVKSGDNVLINQELLSIKLGEEPMINNVKKSTNTENNTVEKEANPSAEKIIFENNLKKDEILPSGKNERILKEDVINHISCSKTQTNNNNQNQEEIVKMSKIRKTIAKRLKDSQNTAAILTTFNEIDMSYVMDLRNKYKDQFEKIHKTKLGFMSFFIKAAVRILSEIPAINAEIKGDDIIYKKYCNIGVAVGTEQGLVVPILRNCEDLSFAQIEKQIVNYGQKAKDGNLTMADMQGGTFTISNGGVYGSLLSTPIINPPQSGILGLHNIVKRPVVVDDQIVIRPMMYTALSYDHRIVDGKEAVTFLVRIKQLIEDPQRLLLEI